MSEQNSNCAVGWPGYEVGDDGTVLSYWRPGGFPKIGTVPRKLKQFPNPKNRYLYVALCNAGAQKGFTVHRLVLTAFVGPRPDGMQACHNNGVPSDNRLVNLRWDTSKRNHADQVLHGTQPIGTRNPQARLTEADVLEIRSRIKNGELLKSIATDFGVARSTISQIKLGRNWQWLASPLMPPKSFPRSLIT